MSRARPVIAIDGPSGVGKSTLAARLAAALGFTKLDTGAMYRALALKAIENDYDLDDEASLATLAQQTRIHLERSRVLLDSRDVSERVRDADVTQAASRASVHPRVRAWLVAQQQQMGTKGGIVMEGRDIGTVVFPDAEVKIFLDARDEVRSSRRYLQAAQAGSADEPLPGEEEVLRQIRERDARDRSRDASPLMAAPDATKIDTTDMTLEEVVAKALAIVRERFPDSSA